MITTYIGVIDGLRVWEVRDDDGTLVGTNTTPDLEDATPATISARQVRLWLIGRGISLSAVDAAIAAIPDQQQRETAQVEWQYAPYLERTHPLLIPLAAALGLTEAQVDEAFREASAL